MVAIPIGDLGESSFIGMEVGNCTEVQRSEGVRAPSRHGLSKYANLLINHEKGFPKCS